MLRPLGLPPGSVRALLLLGLVARVILDLRAGQEPASWLLLSVMMAAAAYFSARASSAAAGAGASGEPTRTTAPLGLPAGTIRLLLLAAAGYAVFLLYDRYGTGSVEPQQSPALWLLAAFVLGVIVRVVALKFARPQDAGTGWGWHLQALTVLLAVGGLVAIGATGRQSEVAQWIQVLLAAGPIYYFATR